MNTESGIALVTGSSGTIGSAVMRRELEAESCSVKDLPLKEPVVLEFMPAKAGVFDFTCGMKMLSGKIVVR